MSSFIDDLADIPGLNTFASTPAATPRVGPAAKAATPAETYPCDSCAGTGKYRGVRLHQPESRCFACNGRGWFKTSTADRYKARAQAADRKARVATELRSQFAAANPELVAKLEAVKGWNTFAADMLTAIGNYGFLTENQTAACDRMFAKIDARQAERAAAKTATVQAAAANSGSVDVSAIEALFATARANGLKRLAFVAGDLKIVPAKESSRNPGALYVTRGGDYQGKLTGGEFKALAVALPDTLPRLLELAGDPAGVARLYGQRTGVCCCCGRELTDPQSIAAGIGPICASKWGL